MMTTAELAAALRGITPEIGSFACRGCGIHNCGIRGCALLREAAERLRGIDARPSAHFVHDGPRFAGGVDWWHCSNCGRLASGVETRFDYCPWCGARMDGDSDALD